MMIGLGAMGGFFTAAPLVRVLIWLTIGDVIVGTMAAVGNPGDGLFGTQVKARLMLKGLMLKTSMFFLIAGVYLVRQAVTFDFPMPDGVLTLHPANALAAALCVYEFISLVENYIKLGGKVPSFIQALLDRWHSGKQPKLVVLTPHREAPKLPEECDPPVR